MAPQKATRHSMVHSVENPRQFHFGMKDMDSLSSDQRLLYEYTVDISRDKVDPRNWSIKPGKVVNFGHQPHVPIDSWGISTESFDQTI